MRTRGRYRLTRHGLQSGHCRAGLLAVSACWPTVGSDRGTAETPTQVHPACQSEKNRKCLKTNMRKCCNVALCDNLRQSHVTISGKPLKTKEKNCHLLLQNKLNRRFSLPLAHVSGHDILGRQEVIMGCQTASSSACQFLDTAMLFSGGRPQIGRGNCRIRGG